ncbi:MAG: acyl-CoA dehydrogenase [Pseudomonadota bacterium]
MTQTLHAAAQHALETTTAIVPERLPSPFYGDEHLQLFRSAARWAHAHAASPADGDPAALTRRLVRQMGDDGLLTQAVPPPGQQRVDIRSFCAVREGMAFHSGLVEVAFAMQAISAAPLAPFQHDALCAEYLEGVRRGHHVAGFALTEPQGGSDVQGIATTARREGGHYVLDGRKAWISNGGAADFYVLVARTGEPGARDALSAFLLDADTPGLRVEPVRTLSRHPLAHLSLDNCRVPAQRLIGEPGAGFRIAMANLQAFRPSVGACAVGFARRALHECLQRMGSRTQFGQRMLDMDAVQAKLADMHIAIETAVLAVEEAASAIDAGRSDAGHSSSIAKLVATESAFQVIDSAVQLFGAEGLAEGCIVEQLWREIRALRIGEGASEIQKLLIARSTMQTPKPTPN